MSARGASAGVADGEACRSRAATTRDDAVLVCAARCASALNGAAAAIARGAAARGTTAASACGTANAARTCIRVAAGAQVAIALSATAGSQPEHEARGQRQPKHHLELHVARVSNPRAVRKSACFARFECGCAKRCAIQHRKERRDQGEFGAPQHQLNGARKPIGEPAAIDAAACTDSAEFARMCSHDGHHVAASLGRIWSYTHSYGGSLTSTLSHRTRAPRAYLLGLRKAVPRR